MKDQQTEQRPFMKEKNENYDLGLGLTPEQATYFDEWKRSRPVSGGHQARPWSSIGFKSIPGRNANLTPESRFVDGSLVDVVILRHPAILPQLTEKRRRYAFPALVQSGSLAPDGTMQVSRLQRVMDFASWPLQDYHRCDLLEGAGEIKAFKRHPSQHNHAETVVVRTSDLWVDINVGADRGRPILAYRFPRAEAEEIVGGVKTLEIVETKSARPEQVLAILHRPIRYFKAKFEPDGSIHWFRVGKHRVAASQKVGLFKMLNRMHRQQNDMIFLPPAERPPILTPELQPRVKIAFTISEAMNLMDIKDPYGRPAWQPTPYLMNMIRNAIGIRNASEGFHITSEFDGTITGIEPTRQEHLKQIKFGDKYQIVPVSAVLLQGIDEGTTVKKGQPIADVCERFTFNSWQEVGDVLGVNRDNYLVPEFVARQIIWPGQQGWNGNSTALLDYEIAESLCTWNPDDAEFKPRQWCWDFGPCREFFDPACEGYVLPPIYTPTYDTPELDIGPMSGVIYNLATPWEESEQEEHNENMTAVGNLS